MQTNACDSVSRMRVILFHTVHTARTIDEWIPDALRVNARTLYL